MSEGQEGDKKEKEGEKKRTEVGGQKVGVGGRGEGSRGGVMEKGKEDRERRRWDFICSRRYHNSALLPAECNLREFCFQLSHSVQRNVSARGVMHETLLKQSPSIFAARRSHTHNRLYTFTVSRYSVHFRAHVQ